MSRTRFVVLLVFLVAVSALLAWFFTKPVTPDPSRLTRAPQKARPATSLPPATVAPSDAPRSGPLPPASTPVRQILPELQARAAAGEAPAACRLAQELDRCARLKEHQRAAAEAIAASQREGLFGDILRRRHDLAEKAQARFYEIAAACEDVAPEVAVQAWRHILSAARAGHGPSMALYVAHRGFLDGHEPLAVLDGWIAFRDEGPQFLRRAVEMGEPGVYPIAAVAYGTGQWFGLKVERDPALALALTLARARAIPGSDTRTLETIVMAAGQRWNASADDIARGQQLADDYAERLRARLAQRPAQSGPASSCDP